MGRSYGNLPPEQRQRTYDIAVNDECAPWRQWLDDQFALLPCPVVNTMARRIWLDEHFWPVNFELAAGAGLRAAGLEVAYEQDWDGATPDWTVLSHKTGSHWLSWRWIQTSLLQPPSARCVLGMAWLSASRIAPFPERPGNTTAAAALGHRFEPTVLQTTYLARPWLPCWVPVRALLYCH